MIREKMRNRFGWLAEEAVTEADGREAFNVRPNGCRKRLLS